MQPYQPRSQVVEDRYRAFIKNCSSEMFDLATETIIREFAHWVIIENRFPYDNIARINHLLVSREPLVSIHDTSANVRNEYDHILQTLATEELYDACIENFPRSASVKKHRHVHLIAWHNSDS